MQQLKTIPNIIAIIIITLDSHFYLTLSSKCIKYFAKQYLVVISTIVNEAYIVH